MTTKTPTEMIVEMTASVEKMEKDHAERGTLTDAIRKDVAEMKDGFEALKKAHEKRSLRLPGVENEKESFSLTEAIKAVRFGTWKEAGFEAEVINETHKLAVKAGHPSDVIHKDILAGTGSTGGFLLPVVVSDQIIPLAIAKRPILNEMGITKMTDLAVGDCMLPKQTGRATGAWIGEQQAGNKSAAAFNRNSLKMKKYGVYTIVSNDIKRQGKASIEAFIRGDLGDALSLGLETALLTGTGSSYQPLGIVNTSGLTAYTGFGTRTNGIQFGFRDAAGMANALDNADGLDGTLGYVTNPNVLFGLKIQGSVAYSGQTTNTPPITRPGGPIRTAGEVDAILGYKMRTSTLVPKNLTVGSTTTCTYVVFGDWAQVVLGMWGGTEIKVSDTASDGTTNALIQDCFFVNALQTADVLIRDPSRFTVLADNLSVVGEVI